MSEQPLQPVKLFFSVTSLQHKPGIHLGEALWLTVL